MKEISIRPSWLDGYFSPTKELFNKIQGKEEDLSTLFEELNELKLRVSSEMFKEAVALTTVLLIFLVYTLSLLCYMAYSGIANISEMGIVWVFFFFIVLYALLSNIPAAMESLAEGWERAEALFINQEEIDAIKNRWNQVLFPDRDGFVTVDESLRVVRFQVF